MENGVTVSGMKLSYTELAAIAGFIIIAAAVGYSVVTIAGIGGTLVPVGTPIGPTPLPTQGGSVALTVIGVNGCARCTDFSQLIDALNTSGLSFAVSHLNMTDSAAQKIISDYRVEELPALLVRGNSSQTDAIAIAIPVRNGTGGYVIEPDSAPYYSVTGKKLVGVVDIVLINDSKCANCTRLTDLVAALGDAGVELGAVAWNDINSPEGNALARLYNVSRAPFAVIGSDIRYYPSAEEAVANLSRNMSGTYVLEAPAPYRELATGKIRGLAQAVYVTDASCGACYNISLHDTAFANIGITIANRTVLDVSSAEGRALVGKYNITGVPTVLLSPETSVYSFMDSSWASVGSVEPDGWYVFREVGLAGTYRNLTSGAIVNGTGNGG